MIRPGMLLLLGLFGGLAAAAAAQTPGDKRAGEAVHVPELNAVCALGAEASAGCAAIRARDILDARTAPWHAIGRVNFASLEIRSHCTGTLVAEDVVLTAAHCLYNAPRKSWIPPESLRFVAGYQRGTGLGLAGVRRYVLDPAQDPTSRVFRGGLPRDWALLVLDKPLGREIGTIPLAGPASAPPAESDVGLAGYAGLRPHVMSLARDCGPARPARGDGWVILVTACPAMQGDSGAPLLQLTGTGADLRLQVLGVLSAVSSTDEGLRALSIPVDRIADALAEITGD